MNTISEAIVEETWQEVADFSPDRAVEEMEKLDKEQPYLLSFMLELSSELDRETQELAIYMFFTIYRMFQKGSPAELKTISSEKIIQSYENNQEFLTKLEGAHDKFFERIAEVQLSQQPYVMKYMIEAFFEDPVEEQINLTDEDIGCIFLLLKTVIDILDKEINP